MSEADNSTDASIEQMAELKYVGPSKAESLVDAGYKSAADVAEADIEALSEVDGVGESLAENIQEAAEDAESEPERHRVLDISEAKYGVQKKICALRILRDEMEFSEVDIEFGEDPEDVAWTDGESQIVVTEDAVYDGAAASWVFSAYKVLCKMLAHESDSTESEPDAEYFERFSSLLDEHEEVVYDYADRQANNGVNATLREGGHDPKEL